MSDRIPDAARTKETLSEILSGMKEKGPKINLDWLTDFFKNLSPFAWVLIIGGISVLIGLLVYTIMSRVKSKNSLYHLSSDSGEGIPEEDIVISVSSSHYFDIAEQQASNSQYSEGIVSLYRASISSMIEQGLIVEQTGATNREIRRTIRSNERCLDSFTLLAGYSEHILFNEETLNEQEYMTAKDTYIRGFVNK